MSTTQTIYLARHGLTEGNIISAGQGFDDPLSEVGHQQAKRLAARAAHVPFDILLASDMVRAQQTAKYVAESTGHTIVSEPLLREVWCPSELIGVPRAREDYQAYLAADRAHFADESWRYSDAENFYDIKNRAVHTLEKFATYESATLFAVTHGQFIRVLVATVLMNGTLTPDVWAEASRTIRTHNTGITILRRECEQNQWGLLAVNDHSHFADE